MLLLCGTPSHSTGVCVWVVSTCYTPPISSYLSPSEGAGGIKAQWPGSLDQKVMVAGSNSNIWGRGMRGSGCKTLYHKYGPASLVKDIISLF